MYSTCGSPLVEFVYYLSLAKATKLALYPGIIIFHYLSVLFSTFCDIQGSPLYYKHKSEKLSFESLLRDVISFGYSCHTIVDICLFIVTFTLSKLWWHALSLFSVHASLFLWYIILNSFNKTNVDFFFMLI